jgi:hypothetical protein
VRYQDEVIRSVLEFIDVSATTRILDIGCGLGVVDAVATSYLPINAIHLLDGDGSVILEPLRVAVTDFGYTPEAWADVRWAGELVRFNVAADVEVTTHVQGVDMREEIGEVDLVISTRSWGFHYPASTYAAEVRNILSPRGRVVMDIKGESCLTYMIEHGYELVGHAGTGKRDTYVLTKS